MKSINFQITKKKILFAAIIFTLMLALTTGITFSRLGTQTAYAGNYLYASEYNDQEIAVRSTVTLDDEFTDCTVLVTLSRAASRDLRDFTIRDFPEFDKH